MVIKHNLKVVNSTRMFGLVNVETGGLTEKLSSGYRVNRSADDAAGLAISEKMRRQIRGLTQASANVQDDISLVQSAEGALNEIHDMLQRGNELAVKAANGTLTDEERSMVDEEIQQLKEAVDKVAEQVSFNELRLFPPDGESPQSLQRVATKQFDIQFDFTSGNVSIKEVGYSADAGITRDSGGTGSLGSVLAQKIANEYIPNAIKQILNAFPALKTAVGSDKVDMKLDIGYIDGPSNTLAFAQASIYSGGGDCWADEFLVKVDSADFTDADITGEKAEMLESTLAHELMHSVMQYTMTKDFVGYGGKTALPLWFIEGTAQLTGGGYTTGWNDWLHQIVDQLSGQSESQIDATIALNLKRWTVDDRPYGHGYLAAAYAGYLANGSGEVSSAAIAAGMNKIFADILGGKSYDQAIRDRTGKTVTELKNAINNASADAVTFVRKLSTNSLGGAGSVITSNLGVGGTDILGNSATPNSLLFQIEGAGISVDPGGDDGGDDGGDTGGGTGDGGGGTGSGSNKIVLQVGAEAGQHIEVKLFQMDSKAIGLENTNTTTAADSDAAIESFKLAIGYVSNVRSYYGAIQNRLEHTINNLDNIVENTSAAESQIRDADIAELMVKYANNQILLQAGQTMIAQANQQPQSVLSLLQ